MRSIPVARLLMNVGKGHGVVFRLGSEVVDPLVVFDGAGYLPAVAHCAELLAQETMGWSLGVQVTKDAQSVFGVRVEPQTLRASYFQGSMTGLMYLRAADICFGWKKNTDVDLKAVYERMASQLVTVDGQSEGTAKRGD